MSLDQLGRTAAEDLHRRSGAAVDTHDLLVSLHRTRRRRTTARTVTVTCLVLALGTAGWLAVRPSRGDALPTAPSPTPVQSVPILAHRNGAVVGVVSPGYGWYELKPTAWRQDGLPHPTEAWTIPSDSAYSDLSWSPDGTRLAQATTSEVRVTIVAGEETESLGRCSGCSVAWSPAGDQIAVGTSQGIELWSAGGPSRTHLAGIAGRAYQLDWSPDGTRLAYLTGDGSDTHVEVLTIATGAVRVVAQGRSQALPEYVEPSWSADGATLALLRLSPADQEQWQLSVVLVPADGGAPRTLSADEGTCYCLGRIPALAWSPDGARIAVLGGGGLRILDAVDGTGHAVATEPGFNGPIEWQPLPG